MKIIFLLMTALLFSFNTLAHAEDGCPPGMVPEGGGGVSACRPISGYNNQPQAGQQLLQPPRPLWDNRWGAIANDGEGQVAGVATDKESRQEAENAAINDCKARGGKNCRAAGNYSNQCVAVVSGDQHSNTYTAMTVDQAVSEGIQRCKKNDTNCHVYYSACSLPERIQ